MRALLSSSTIMRRPILLKVKRTLRNSCVPYPNAEAAFSLPLLFLRLLPSAVRRNSIGW